MWHGLCYSEVYTSFSGVEDFYTWEQWKIKLEELIGGTPSQPGKCIYPRRRKP